MRKILLNLGLRSIGKDIFGPYNKLRSLEYNSDDANKKIQEEKLKKILGENVIFDFHVVDEIKPSKSEKYLYVISEVR